MRALHGQSRRLAWLIAPAVATGIALSAAPAQATVSSPGAAAAPGAPASGLIWHKLTLVHGWHAATGYGSGTPRWALQNGIVHLAGSVARTGGGSVTFAFLPKAARPAHAQYINIYTYSNTRGQLYLDPTGYMALGGPGSSIQTDRFSSLAGVTFLAAHTSATRLHLRAGWQEDAAVDRAGPGSYTVRDGVVYLSGVVRHTSGSDLIAAILPKGARPAQTTYMTTESDSWVPAVVEILPNGDLWIYGSDVAQFASLDGLSFTAGKPASHALNLINGWFSPQSSDHTGTPSYRLSGGVVYLSGAVRQSTSGGDTEFAVLPRADWPANNLYISIYTLSGDVGFLLIQNDGEMFAGGSSAWVLTSLAGVSFPLKS
jgi:hypothetical protein